MNISLNILLYTYTTLINIIIVCNVNIFEKILNGKMENIGGHLGSAPRITNIPLGFYQKPKGKSKGSFRKGDKWLFKDFD